MRYGVLIDTTLQGAAMALVKIPDGAGPAAIENMVCHSEVMGSAAAIAGLWQQCLAPISDSLSKVSHVVVSQGPGSFTGIKVGLSFVYGLQSGLPDLLVKGVSSLGVLAEWYSRKDGCPVALLLPATRTHGFLAECQARGGGANVGLFEIEKDFADLQKRAKGSLILCREWPSLPSTDVTVMDIDQVLADSLRAMAGSWGSYTEGFGRDFLPAQYHRLSTAEEKLQTNPGGVGSL